MSGLNVHSSQFFSYSTSSVFLSLSCDRGLARLYRSRNLLLPSEVGGIGLLFGRCVIVDACAKSGDCCCCEEDVKGEERYIYYGCW